MGGLQGKLITRSKNINGHGVVHLRDDNYSKAKEVQSFLNERGITTFIEYELELLLKNGNYLAPVIVHGLDSTQKLPPFFEGMEIKEAVLSPMLARKVNMGLGDQVRLISPAHTNAIMGDIPRTATLYLDEMISTDVPEVDYYHLWVRLKVLQNLVRKRAANRLRYFGPIDVDLIKTQLNQKFGKDVELKTWEEKNGTLVWALGLETTVMVFLFAAMTLLVSLCITSGLLIFFGKVRGDLASFWIMGTSKKNLEKSTGFFLSAMSIGAVLVGLVFGFIALYLLDQYGIEIMPEEFVDRKIPIKITPLGVMISFLVPTVISMAVSFLSFSQFKKESNYLDYVRTIG